MAALLATEVAELMVPEAFVKVSELSVAGVESHPAARRANVNPRKINFMVTSKV
jgi:hypothetical protein